MVRKTSGMTIDHPPPSRNEHQRVHSKVDVRRKVDDPCLNSFKFDFEKSRETARMIERTMISMAPVSRIEIRARTFDRAFGALREDRLLVVVDVELRRFVKRD
jgi:phosphate starvation-inducible protein PhoH